MMNNEVFQLPQGEMFPNHLTTSLPIHHCIITHSSGEVVSNYECDQCTPHHKGKSGKFMVEKILQYCHSNFIYYSFYIGEITAEAITVKKYKMLFKI